MRRQERRHRRNVIAWSHEASEVTGLDDARERLSNTAMPRDDLDTVEDHDLVVAEEHLDGPTNEAMRHAVANRLDVDEAVASGRAATGAAVERAAACAGNARRACLSPRSKRIDAVARASCRESALSAS